MNKRLTKRQIRQQMEEEIGQYLNTGGEVRQFERGESGLINGRLNDRSSGFEQGKQERTPLLDVLKTVDERKKPSPTPASKEKRPHKKVIYDDFGEPIREVWVD